MNIKQMMSPIGQYTNSYSLRVLWMWAETYVMYQNEDNYIYQKVKH
jgi:hypothetical protein